MNAKLYKLMNWPKIEEIIYSECDNPHAILGPHSVARSTLIQAYHPGAVKAEIVYDKTGEHTAMEIADEEGFFALLVGMKPADVPAYHYVFTKADGTQIERGESYYEDRILAEEDMLRFSHGIHYSVYEKLGAHVTVQKGVKGTVFAVWAPNAMRVSVVGDFNGWDGRTHQMRKNNPYGIFELFIPEAAAGDNYKYEIKLKNGLTYLKADPYANAAQLRPDTASVVTNLKNFSWDDSAYVASRKEKHGEGAPISIYELYLDSYVKEGKKVNYRTIAEDLILRVKELGFTHVQLLPVMEYPFDKSLGYQTLGYYAPTARYGTPKDFMYFVNALHKAGIGVLLDWNPAYFPMDNCGLSAFDGTCLYEHQDARRGYHPAWGVGLYNYGRKEVSNYLIANALFWVEKYHVDGIKVSSVSNLLYLDCAKNEGEWLPNMYGGNENLDGIEFIKHLNSIMQKRNPGVLMIAEENMAYPQVTGDLNQGGLGFSLKWNNGYVQDYLSYIKNPASNRPNIQHQLTFSTVYQYSEKFLVGFLHDAEMSGVDAMRSVMPGKEDEQFANLKLSYAYTYMHTGKKIFYAPDRSTAENNDYFVQMITDLNHLYLNSAALYSADFEKEGFVWINPLDNEHSVLSFERRSADGKEHLLVVANFSDESRQVVTGVTAEGKYKEIFNTDAIQYGGSGYVNPRVKQSRKEKCDECENSVSIRLAPLSISMLRYIPI